jgi:SAM-dependent methyltransferase
MVRTLTSADPARSQWEERFSAQTYLYGTAPNDFLAEFGATIPPGDVLCLAEGEGRNVVFLAEQGYRAHSVDLTVAGVAKTNQLALDRGVDVDARTADLADFDLGTRSWAGIVSIFAHVPAPVRVDLHRRVVDALQPGGVFLLEAYTPQQVGRGTGGPPTPELTMSLVDLAQELAGLEVLIGREIEREVIEGPGHTGLGSVVQFIGKKLAE